MDSHGVKCLGMAVLWGLLGGCDTTSKNQHATNLSELKGKKILYVDSYHASYEPNQRSRRTFEQGIAGKGIVVQTLYLNEKNTYSADSMQRRALRVLQFKEEYQPDLVVVADDPAMDYVVYPHLRSDSTPIVFIGVNGWVDTTVLGMTGQIEVEHVDWIARELQKMAKGPRLGLLTAATVTDRKIIQAHREILHMDYSEVQMVETFEQWKQAYVAMQQQVDVLILHQNAGIQGWDSQEAKQWVLEHTRIPTGSPTQHMAEYVLLCFPKVNEEYGEYLAHVVLKVLSGIPVESIPRSRNQRTNITVNTTLTRRLGLTFPADFLENAHLISMDLMKIAFVNSYHTGYHWSDAIEKAFLKRLGASDSIVKSRDTVGDLDIRFFRMNAKKNPLPDSLAYQAKRIDDTLDSWKPDLIVSCDDDAAQWLIVPYYKERFIPVLFCGLNWDASKYGFPMPHITGMVEVSPVMELIQMLQRWAKGQRMAYLGANRLSEQKEIDYYQKVLHLPFTEGALVETQKEWMQHFKAFQTSADLLILTSVSGIQGWDGELIKKFVIEHTRIPTGSTSFTEQQLALLVLARLPEEQGWWLAEQVQFLHKGGKIQDIPMTQNQRSAKYWNATLSLITGFHLPLEILDSVILVDVLEP